MQAVWVLLAVFVGIVVAVPFLLLYGGRLIAERDARRDSDEHREPSA